MTRVLKNIRYGCRILAKRLSLLLGDGDVEPPLKRYERELLGRAASDAVTLASWLHQTLLIRQADFLCKF